MKKLALVLSLFIVSFTSCKKEDEPTPYNNTNTYQNQCVCGMIQSDRASDYSIVIRNNCSGNNKRFYLSQGDWMNAYVGIDYCISNTSAW